MRRYTRSALLKSITVLTTVLFMSLATAAEDTNVIEVAYDASDLGTANPHLAAGTQDRSLVDLIFNGLVRYTPGDISVLEPDIADSWDVSEDGLRWTFELREDVMCHPWAGNEGYRLTAEDVVFSLDLAASPDTSGYS